MPLQNDTFLRALMRQPTDHTPIWLMRQAGRYLPEYKATRARAGSFLKLCKTPELACEVTLQPLARYPLDAAILFSDILTIPDAMGLGLYFTDGEGPKFERPIKDERDVAALHVPDPNTDLRYVMDAVRTIRGALGDKLPLIGFSGSYPNESVSNRAARASYVSSRPARLTPMPRISLRTSVACKVPMTPTTAPRTPTSAQLGIVPGGGASGNRQR